MADLLAKWLNEDIRLSHKVTDFEADFASGYLLGELLYRFNQQENFAEFSKKDNISTKLKNFEKLEPTLRNLKIKFDSQQVDKIMKQERGYALRLLYQLKMILEKVYPPTDIAILRKTGKVGDNQPALKIGAAKEAYNKMQSSFFKTRLQALNKPQKTMNMEKHLQRFEDEATRQAGEAQRYEAAEAAEKERVKQEVRRAQINKLQRNAGFMEEWLHKGVEDWKQNMAYKKEREQSQLEFEYKQAQKFNQLTVEKIDEATLEVQNGIEQFEHTLMENGINPRVTKEFADRAVAQSFTGGPPGKAAMRTQKMTQSLLSRPTMGLGGTMTKTGGVTLASVGLRSKAKKPLDDKARKDRERRRMRMISDQMNLLHDMEKERREAEVLERMKRQSKQEEELTYESWRTQQCRGVIIEDRKLREAKYDKRRDLDTQNAVFKEKQMLDSMLEQMAREIETLRLRDEFLREKDKEAKKLRQTNEAKKMIDAIFDIAHEAYIHQQKQDSDEIDPRNWHEWEQLFVKGDPIVPEVAAVKEEAAEAEVPEVPPSTAPSSNLDFLELVDYLDNQGQWPTTLVSENKPNIETILTGSADAAPVAGKGKAPAKGAPAEAVQLEEGDMVIDDQPVNNFFVGDAVEQIINLNYEARGRQLRPKNPHYLNLKLCFVGYAFAGKKLQAVKLKQEYGLDVFTLSELVEEALKFFQEHPNPIAREAAIEEAPIRESLHEDSRDESRVVDEAAKEGAAAQEEPNEAVAAADGAGQDDKPPEEEKEAALRENPLFRRSGPVTDENAAEVKSEASEIEEVLNADEDFRRCGEQIQKCLFDGQEIPDQLYVDLYVAKLRMTYEYKSKDRLKSALDDDAKKELELTRLVANLEEELRQMQDPESKVRRKKKRTPEVVEREIAEKRAELEQVKVIENNGWILVDFPTNFGQAMLLEQALSGYQLPADLEATQREREAKDAELLVKPTAKPAPPKTLTPSGLDAVIWFDASREECLRRALGRRVDGQNEVVYHIQDNPPSIDQSPLCEIIEPIDDERESTACLVDRWVAFDQASSGLAKWLTQFGDEASSSNLLTRIDAGGDSQAVYEQIEKLLRQIVERKMQARALQRSAIQAAVIREEEIEQEKQRLQQEEEEARKKKEEEGDKAGDEAPLEDGGGSITKPALSKGSARDASQLTDSDFLPERNNIDNDFKPVLMHLWKTTSSTYKEQMMKVLGKQRLQREEIQQYFHAVQTQFLTFLKRLDNKQQVLEKFIKEFNEFSDQYPDMREDDQTKEELHQRVDILSDELWEIAEERREQAVDERKKIMESGWVEFSLEYLTSCAQQMMQAEIDKFKGTIQLLHDYYHAIEEKLVPEAPETVTVDLMKEDTELPEVERLAEGAELTDASAYSYPRLDDLFRRALKAQVVPDVLAQAAAADAGKKGGGKKDAKKGAAEPDEPKPESAYVKEMREAIKVEKSILRFRLAQIRNWGLSRLLHQRERSLKLYQKLDDWIAVSSKAENDAIEEVCDVIKEATEDQGKIQDELRIKFMDFFVDKGILNYIEPPPAKLASMEESAPSRFNIPQLQALTAELHEVADAECRILDRQLVELLLRKAANSKSFGDLGGLPQEWMSCTRDDFENMVRNFDSTNCGSIDYREFATSCVLLNTPLPAAEEVEAIGAGLEQPELGKEAFVAVSCWFDATESSKDRPYSHPYNRAQLIKGILFDLHADPATALLSLPAVSERLLLSHLRKGKTTLKTYSDLIRFAPQKK